MEAATNSVVSTKRNRKYLGLACGSFLIGFTLFSIMFFPLISDKTGYEILMGYLNESKDVGDEQITPEPYIWVTHDYNGGIGRWEVNETFYRSWLNNTIVWKVEKGVQKDKDIVWSSYNKFTIKKDWDAVNKTEKHTIIVDSDEDAFYRILSNTKADKQLIGYEDCSSKQENATNDYIMEFKITDKENYKVVYNWDDYLVSDTADKSSFTKNIKIEPTSNKQYFEFNVVSDVKVAKGETFVLDPSYGIIANAVVDSWEWDIEEGRSRSPLSLLRLGTSQYYVTSAAGDTGTDVDGFLRVLNVTDEGIFVETLVDSWEYDITDGYEAGIIHISGDVYAIIYHDLASAIGKVFTTTIWESNGTLKENIIDTFNLAYRTTNYPSLIHVTGDVYAAVYEEGTGSYDHQIETIEISTAGVITDVRLDIQEFDTSSAVIGQNGNPSAVMLDSDTIAIVWQEDVGYDVWLCTYNISAAGVITNTYSDIVEFDAATLSNSCPFIWHISGNVYAISYADVDSDGQIKTCTITNTGAITENPEGTITWIDTLEWAGSNTIYYDTVFTVNDASTIPSGQGVYGVTYQDNSGDGQLSTFNITSAGVIDAAIIDNLEFDATDNMFYAPVVHILDDFYLIVYQGTGNDGWARTVNITTYVEEEPTTQWNTVSTWNGTLYNVTDFNTIFTWNGSLYNNSNWITTTWNGSLYNSSNWIANIWNGSLYNSNNWIAQTWNGTIYNNSNWHTLITWNGTLYNNTLVEVITNESTGVSCTNTTLNGFLSDDNGEDCTVRFQFGLTTDYGNTTLNQTKSIGQTFSDNLIYNDTSINSISNKGTYTKIKEKQVFYDGIVSIDWQYRGYDGSPQNVYTQMWVNGVPIGTEFEHLRDGDWRQVSNQEVTVNAGDYVQIYGKQQFAGANVNVAVRYFDISYPLEEDTTYHYRAVANNSYGVFYGQDKSFTTLICLEWYIVSTWNGSIFNSTSWIASAWNGSIYNGSSWNQDSIWNGTIYNTTDFRLNQNWNGTIFNSSVKAWNIINNWNGSIYNSSSWFVSVWNGSLFNGTVNWQTKQTWNGTLYNSNNWITTTWNGSIFNSTSWIASAWNGSIYNGSSWNQDSIWNGTIYNTTDFRLNQNWNGTLYNKGSWITQIWNGTLFNGTGLGPTFNITITNIYPGNNSININVQPTLYFTVNNTLGNIMNISWYYGITPSNMFLLGNTTNIFNSTVSKLDFNASHSSTHYYWRVFITDGTNSINKSFSFRTVGISNIIFNPGQGSAGIIGIIGIIGLLGFIFGMRQRRKKKHEVIRETIRFYRR